MINSGVRLGCQVSVDSLMQHVSALVQNVGHDPSVEGEVYLVEADRCHSQGVNLLAEALHNQMLVTIELPVSVEYCKLHNDLNKVLDDLLCFFPVAGVLFGNTVQLVQDLTACVIDEDTCHRL